MDFTLITYSTLSVTLQKQGFLFCSLEQFMQIPTLKMVILRHDIDRLPENALKTAQIESELGITGSYYFIF